MFATLVFITRGASYVQRYNFCYILNVKSQWVWLALGWVASVLTELGIQCWTAPICRFPNLSFSQWSTGVRDLIGPSLHNLILPLYPGVNGYSAIGSDGICRILSPWGYFCIQWLNEMAQD